PKTGGATFYLSPPHLPGRARTPKAPLPFLRFGLLRRPAAPSPYSPRVRIRLTRRALSGLVAPPSPGRPTRR
ncbi:hypothetical protein, partial [Streptomyces virginiae]|uniref:hypothetical protein n=1 Tax=Streptomyces virginiae TaxID=1961 RepID=UPI001BE3F9B5